MDMIFDWNLGLQRSYYTSTLWIFLRENQVALVGIRDILDPRTKPSEMDDRIGCEQPFFRLYTDLAFTFMQGLSIMDLLTPVP